MKYANLRSHWKEALKAVGLTKNFAVLYLRHSGPSHDRLHKLRTSLEVKLRGRWEADSSVKRYEAHSKLGQEFQQLPEEVQHQALRAEQQIGHLMSRCFFRTAPSSGSSLALDTSLGLAAMLDLLSCPTTSASGLDVIFCEPLCSPSSSSSCARPTARWSGLECLVPRGVELAKMMAGGRCLCETVALASADYQTCLGVTVPRSLPEMLCFNLQRRFASFATCMASHGCLRTHGRH